MMFATKMPSLRIDQSELKCKNGCDYFGNPQWQGYCSKCHREQMQRQRRAEKASASTTLPRPVQKKPERGLKSTSHSSFSKFEEKRLRQSETQKKANILKFNVFKKSSTDDYDHTSERRSQEFKIPSMVNEGMKRDFRVRFPNLTPQIDRDSRLFVQTFIMDVMKCANAMTVDELSERVQRQYQRFIKHMDTSPHFANIDADTKELLIDFVEKHAMSYLHELPSVVFSPSGTDDERADRAMSERIQQLSWVGEKHLECNLDCSDADCRDTLYKAISELLGMDRAPAPGGKLARVRRCCRHVLALCAPRAKHASADDLLPALIFTVLKANPPRLVSNINFVTRFCNAQRLMTGEGGYYFTNLCCAVSFIENLNAESLSMDKKEFDCYMAMPASIGGSSWAAALSLCAELHEAGEQRAQLDRLLGDARRVHARADTLAHAAITFQCEISKKVEDVLAKTPLEIKPRRELPSLRNLLNSKTMPLIDLGLSTSEEEKQVRPAEEPPVGTSELNTQVQLIEPEIVSIEPVLVPEKPNSVVDFETPPEKPSPSKSPQNLDRTWEIKQTNSLELLTPSPLGFTSFDSRSLDELMTPDDFGTDHLAPGLSNINYDIDLSDLSGDNSYAEDAPKSKDPFSPDGLKKDPFDPFTPQPRDPFSPILESFDQFSLIDSKTNVETDPFEIIHRPQDPVASGLTTIEERSSDPFSPVELKESRAIAEAFRPPSETVDPFVAPKEGPSLLDDSESPTTVNLLPSPLQPQSSKQT